jgi:hypothetical protein
MAMELWVELTLGVLGLVIVGFWSAIGLGSARWNNKTTHAIERLIQSTPHKELKTVTFKDLRQLPGPVAEYFRWALKEGQPLIRSARIKQEGEIRTGKA